MKGRDQKEAQILLAAEKLLAVRGFHGTTMDHIAQAAQLLRPNLYYYFPSKQQIYRRIIKELHDEWIKALQQIVPEHEPKQAIGSYIRAKIDYTRRHPAASKIFTKEVMRGSDMLTAEENQKTKALTDEKCAVIRGWMDAGKMDHMNPHHFFFLLWGATQYYADFEQQIKTILGVKKLTRDHFESGVQTVTQIILKGCGLSD